MQTVKVLDSHIAYHEDGRADGPTVLFLHGNPTTSHLWRNVTPYMAGLARTLAPDLIGMGDSGKPDIEYRFADHARYLDAFIEALDLREIILVGHDWGGALAQDWAARHPDRTRAIVLLETFLRPMTWADYPSPVDEIFQRLRTPGVGEQMVLEENFFIEVGLRATNPEITDEDMAVYGAPYPDPASRRPLLQWGREHPVEGEPADVHDRVVAYGKWMADTPQVPKLLLTIEPEGMVTADIEEWTRENSAALEVESIGTVGHHAPEGAPDAIGVAIADWLVRHRLAERQPASR
jgi:haloalkane dehalogenase